MQQFMVPKFIDVEDKVIGPLAVRQFIILLVAGGLVFGAYKIFDFSLFLVSSIIIVLAGFVFAFIKVNGAPFHFFLLNLLQTWRRPQLRVWNKLNEITDDPVPMFEVKKIEVKTPVAGSRLSQLALIADTQGYYAGEANETAKISRFEPENLK